MSSNQILLHWQNYLEAWKNAWNVDIIYVDIIYHETPAYLIAYNLCPKTVITTGTNDFLANIHVVEISQGRTIIIILECTFNRLQFYNVYSVCDGSTKWWRVTQVTQGILYRQNYQSLRTSVKQATCWTLTWLERQKCIEQLRGRWSHKFHNDDSGRTLRTQNEDT